MIALVLAAILAAPLPAQAQTLFKCIDERGRVSYSDKPRPGCKGDQKEIKPPPGPAVQPRAAPPPESPRQVAERVNRQRERERLSEQEAAQLPARCRGWREELDWLQRSQIENKEARIGQVQQALRRCP